MKRRLPKHKKWEDHYTRKARKENYPARSVYKLREIQKKTRLIPKGGRVLDLGCAPGSWLLYAAELVGPSGSVTGVDVKPVSVAAPPRATVIQADVSGDIEDLIGRIGVGYDAVISDMAPDTTGNKAADAARSHALCAAALAVADAVLAPGGGFLCKIFQGEDFEAFRNQVKTRFQRHRIIKPDSSRKASKEIFIIGTGKK